MGPILVGWVAHITWRAEPSLQPQLETAYIDWVLVFWEIEFPRGLSRYFNISPSLPYLRIVVLIFWHSWHVNRSRWNLSYIFKNHGWATHIIPMTRWMTLHFQYKPSYTLALQSLHLLNVHTLFCFWRFMLLSG